MSEHFVYDESKGAVKIGRTITGDFVVFQVLPDGATPIDGTVTPVGRLWDFPETHHEIISAVGTAQQLNGGTSKPLPDGSFLLLQNDPETSTGFVRWGETKAKAEGASAQPLDVGEGILLMVKDASTIWVDTAVPGQKVLWYIMRDV